VDLEEAAVGGLQRPALVDRLKRGPGTPPVGVGLSLETLATAARDIEDQHSRAALTPTAETTLTGFCHADRAARPWQGKPLADEGLFVTP